MVGQPHGPGLAPPGQADRLLLGGENERKVGGWLSLLLVRRPKQAPRLRPRTCQLLDDEQLC
jgi:hypothetical protein